MIQLILVLFGLAFPNNIDNTTTINSNQNNVSEIISPDTGGETGQTPPPRK